MTDELLLAARRYRSLDALIPSHWRAGEASVNGVRLAYYRTGGDKTVLLLMHGFNVDGLTWLRIAKAFEQSYDVIMPDMRGHGRSVGLANGFSTALLVEDTAAFLSALTLKKVRLLGHSMGADVAARLAYQYPELVAAVAMEDPPLRPMNSSAWQESEGYQAWQRDWLTYLEKMATQSHAERIEATVARQMPGQPLAAEDDFVSLMEAQMRFNRDVLPLIKNPSDVQDVPLIELLPLVVQPKLLMLAQPSQGSLFHQDHSANVAYLESRWQSGTVEIFKDTSHFIHGERFEDYMETVQAFFDTLP